ncbi:MAG TPA: hypothetical protein VFP90_03400 [Gemmatimonadaceae bacterium]|nr:hypothetical protein [Gemmatimonadaceae bacterium]
MPRSDSGARRRAHVARTVAAAALALGYADLARGGTVLAPLALVLGYVVLVPTALLAH